MPSNQDAESRKIASSHNRRLIASIERRAAPEGHVLHACLASYRQWLRENDLKNPAERLSELTNLTHHLVSTFEVTERAIRVRMVEKWEGDRDAERRVESSVTNSLRRSAGTNFQSLVSYAVATMLERLGSTWYVVFPIPPAFGRSLSIRFGDIDVASQRDEGDESPPDEGEAEEASVVVSPDLDLLLRNAAWVTNVDMPEPVLVLSVKTSLADRAGSAARWKTYFDLVTQPCEHVSCDSCAYRKLAIRLADTPNVSITHGIVTANIYKMNSDPHFAKYGELGSNQAKANTFMFDLRYTTRDDTPEVMSPGWQSLVELPLWLQLASETPDEVGQPVAVSDHHDG